MLHLTSTWIKRLRKEKEDLVKQQSLANPAQTLAQKYGRCGHVLGWGAFGTVRIAHKTDAKDPKRELLFAVKELKQHPGESVKKYYKRLTAEFCISSSLHHQNVVATLDLLQDAKGVYCQIMEYCSGGDLHTVILTAGQLEETEADCFFKQLIRGVEYMHEMGVAHRDLKPENILLTQCGTIKVTDFGNAECFRTAWETNAHMSAGVCGSAPYIAPEEYVDKEFDPRAVDIWACGVIYMAMRTGQHLWRVARTGKDESFKRYVEDRKTEAGYGPIEVLRRVRL
jgi:protein-serine/threonine kinase